MKTVLDMKVWLICNNCHNPFLIRKSKQYYAKTCGCVKRNKSRSMKVWLICENCGNPFLVNASYQHHKCCSHRCGSLNVFNKNPELLKNSVDRLSNISKSNEMREKNRQIMIRLQNEANFKEKSRAATRKSLKERWKDPEFREKHSKRMIEVNQDKERFKNRDEKASEILSNVAKKFNAGNRIPKAQKLLYDELDFCDFTWEHFISFKEIRHYLDDMDINLKWTRIDIAHLESKVAIEVDGWSHTMPRYKERDVQREKALRLLGWETIRIKNEDVFNNIEQVKKQIDDLVGWRLFKLCQ